MVTQTSINAFIEHKSEESLGMQQLSILKFLRIKGLGYTDRELSRALGISRNVVPARRGELVDAGLVVLDRVGVCPIGKKKAKFWRAYDED